MAEESGYIFNTYLTTKVNDSGTTTEIINGYTNASVELLEMYEEWYREPTPEELEENPDQKSVKILPCNFELTAYKLRIWYLEDGTLKPDDYYVRLCSYNFTDDENYQLAQLVRNLLGMTDNMDDISVQEHFDPRKNKFYPYIRLKGDAVTAFFNVTGWKSPIECFNYKFDTKPRSKPDPKWKFQCYHCKRGFETQEALKTHISYSHRMKFTDKHCPYCGYKASKLNVLKRHLAGKHDIDVEWHYCNSCDFKTKYKTSLRRHAANKHNKGVKWHHCDYCSFKTKNLHVLKGHFANKHDIGVEWHYCSHCSFKAKRKYIIHRHIERKHR